MSEIIKITYKNYKGEISERKIQPISLKYRSTEYHKDTWILKAYDIEKKVHRDFALTDITFDNDLKSQFAQANERLEKLVDLCDEACLDQIAGDDESILKPLDDAKQFLKELTIAKSEGK